MLIPRCVGSASWENHVNTYLYNMSRNGEKQYKYSNTRIRFRYMYTEISAARNAPFALNNTLESSVSLVQENMFLKEK